MPPSTITLRSLFDFAQAPSARRARFLPASRQQKKPSTRHRIRYCLTANAVAHYVDLHSHFLPGLDDGADSLATCLSMVRALAEMGFSDLCATPHQFAGLFQPPLDRGEAYLRPGEPRDCELYLPEVRLLLGAENYWDDVLRQPTAPRGTALLRWRQGIPFRDQPGRHAAPSRSGPFRHTGDWAPAGSGPPRTVFGGSTRSCGGRRLGPPSRACWWTWPRCPEPATALKSRRPAGWSRKAWPMPRLLTCTRQRTARLLRQDLAWIEKRLGAERGRGDCSATIPAVSW